MFCLLRAMLRSGDKRLMGRTVALFESKTSVILTLLLLWNRSSSNGSYSAPPSEFLLLSHYIYSFFFRLWFPLPSSTLHFLSYCAESFSCMILYRKDDPPLSTLNWKDVGTEATKDFPSSMIAMCGSLSKRTVLTKDLIDLKWPVSSKWLVWLNVF